MSTQQGPDRTERRRQTDRRYGPDEAEEAGEVLTRDPQNQQAEQGEDPLAISVPDWPNSVAPASAPAGTGGRGDAETRKPESSTESSAGSGSEAPDVDVPAD
ncbi:hypothetical protein ACFCXK_03340 [Streptomyces sp. NPDC056269]|uniref:hypothetical protein n=1 Tax=Streptomyces sp. NPDC056269 TaxID=3345768 RepID=UPI0035D86F00